MDSGAVRRTAVAAVAALATTTVLALVVLASVPNSIPSAAETLPLSRDPTTKLYFKSSPRNTKSAGIKSLELDPGFFHSARSWVGADLRGTTLGVTAELLESTDAADLFVNGTGTSGGTIDATMSFVLNPNPEYPTPPSLPKTLSFALSGMQLVINFQDGHRRACSDIRLGYTTGYGEGWYIGGSKCKRSTFVNDLVCTCDSSLFGISFAAGSKVNEVVVSEFL
mmetsp:Transcript_17738/g.45852  ORF Transcript_17738/g.45852 Transcript_17738/m.45852 type:complete len:224 (-) Transcript_17738:179-850(-)